MKRIRVLPDNLANQIAAGEVVERPASVVKELVENAIDAGATRVQVDIELGGRRLMRVSDDGHGMVRDDAILAFERHATSKLDSFEMLSAITTLGFRGEALASIASVAKVELITKTEDDDVATRVGIDGGRLMDVRDAARGRGTTISVRDLFYNTPARRKFMRAEATENYHLTAIIQHYALARPDIAFTLTNNGRDVLRLAPARDTRERAYQIFGGSLIESLLPVSGGRDYVAKITGFVSAPRERRTNRDAQYFFVNNRFVKDKTIAGGLLEGFRAVLPHGVYPVAILFLDIPLDEIDVNVHPAKTEIRLRRAEAVRETIAEAVRAALQGAGVVRASEIDESVVPGYVPEPRSFEVRTTPPVATQTELTFHDSSPAPETVSQAPAIEPVFYEVPVFSDDFEARAAVLAEPDAITEARAPQARDYSAPPLVMPPVDSALKVTKPAEVADFSLSKVKPVGQLHDSFIIAVDDEGLLLVDQHVAHERILFDKFRSREESRPIESQNLLIPETFDLTPAQAAAFTLVENDLEALGFGVMRLSGRTIAVKSVPTDLPAAEARNLLMEVLDTVEAEKRGAAKATFRDDIAASLACKAAVKINMKLTPEKMQWLIDRLLVTSSPTTCPHGRPVILRLTMKDIGRAFHRT